MKLKGWAQYNVSNSDMKARIIGVHSKMQLLVSSMDFSLPLQYFPIQITSALAFREQSYVNWLLKILGFLSLFLEVYDQTGMHASI